MLDTIPGAPELADAVRDARQAIASAAKALRETGAAANVLGHDIGRADAGPRSGVTLEDFTVAHEAYRAARTTESAAQEAHRRALAKLHTHVNAGMRTDEFKAQHEAIAAGAQKNAETALVDLREAITQRETTNRVIGRTVRVDDGWYGIDAALRDVTEYVNAAAHSPEDDFKAAAEAIISGNYWTTSQRAAAARAVRDIDKLDLSTGEKIARFKQATGSARA